MHKAEPFIIPKPPPTADQRTDLRAEPPSAPSASLSNAIKYTCKECGYVEVTVGPEQKSSQKDVFTDLQRGTDWTAPPS